MTLDKWLDSRPQSTTRNPTAKRKADPLNNHEPTPSKRAKANTSQNPRNNTQIPADMDPGTKAPSKASSKNPRTLSTRPRKTLRPSAPSPESTKSEDQNQPSSPLPTLKVTETSGDLFAAPPATLLIHACNCQGSWSAGIAAAFKQHYPNAHKAYAAHCKKWTPDQLRGTAYLIPPSGGEKHWVGCLFTSRRFGLRKDKPGEILEATKDAMEDLVGQVEEMKAGDEGDGEGGEGPRVDDGGSPGELWMCQINSGKFGVPWEETREVLEGIEVGEGSKVKEVKVVSRD